MRALAALILLALGIAGAAMGPAMIRPPAANPTGNLVYVQGSYRYELTDEPCRGDASYLEEEGIPPAKRAIVTSGSRVIATCYVREMGGDVMSMDMLTGEVGVLPAVGFRQQ